MKIQVDFSQNCGKIKAMHAVGQPPRNGMDDTFMHYLTEAHIPYSRLHDVGGWMGGNLYVDIPNIFRDFDADVNDPASYDFTFTDLLLKQLMDAGCEPYFRLGVTIENFANIKAYRIFPPKDFHKWAEICEHIIRHYNEGWNDGFTYGITYWEIWNEPDSCHYEKNCTWRGTREDYFRFYETAAKHLKKCFGDTIKIGGPAVCGFYDIMNDPQYYGYDFPARGKTSAGAKFQTEFALLFLDYVKETGAPLDFLSWHGYAPAADNEIYADFIHNELVKRGFTNVESHLNEWNDIMHSSHQIEMRASSEACAKAAAMMLALQYKPVDILCYYDARFGPSIYGGLFNCEQRKPYCTYYAFKAFGEMYALGTQAACDFPRGENIYAVAASGGDRRALMITNIGEAQDIETNLPADGSYHVYVIDENHMMTEVSYSPKWFRLEKYQTVFIEA